MASVTITLDPDTEAALDSIAEATQKGKDQILAEALASIVHDEAEIIAKIKRGLADVEAGRTTPHEEAMAEMQAIIDEAKQRQR